MADADHVRRILVFVSYLSTVLACSSLALSKTYDVTDEALESPCWTTDFTACLSSGRCGICVNTFTCMEKDNETGSWLNTSLPCGLQVWENRTEEALWCTDKPSCMKAMNVWWDEHPDAYGNNSIRYPCLIDGSWDLTCKNGGQRSYKNTTLEKGLERAWNWGGSTCDCPDGFGGIDCGVCTVDGVCPAFVDENGVIRNSFCDKNVDTEHLVLHCELLHSALDDYLVNVLNDYIIGLSRWRVSIEWNRTEGQISLEIFKPVESFLTNWSWINTGGMPSSLINKAVWGACAPVAELPCSTFAKRLTDVNVPVPWGGNASQMMCTQWSCKKTTTVDCGPNLPFNRWHDSCTAGMSQVFQSPLEVVCPSKAKGTAPCSFFLGDDGQLGITAQCQFGACSGTNHSGPAPVTPAKHFCDKYAWVCSQQFLSAASLTAPTLAMLVLLLVAYMSTRPGFDGRKEHRLTALINDSLESNLLDVTLMDVGGAQPRPPVQSRHDPDPEETWLTFEHVRYQLAAPVLSSSSPPLGSRHRILRGVTGVCPPGLTAVMGPSGCGKSTFLDILSGRRREGIIEGYIGVNGLPLQRSWRRQLVGYVMQDDILMGDCTVWEYLLFHANLRLPVSLSLEEREQRVVDVLMDLNLGKVRSSLIGTPFKRGISGGEKRRVSIGVQLVTEAPVLILDEPTSGLDSVNAHEVVSALMNVANHGKCIILSIHQPSSSLFHLFDRIVLFSALGETLYSGPRSKVLQHFAGLGLKCPRDYNPADYLLDIATRLSPSETERLARSWETSTVAAKEKDTIATVTGVSGKETREDQRSFPEAEFPSCGRQLRFLTSRGLSQGFRHPLLIGATTSSAVVMGLLVGSIFWEVGGDFAGAVSRAGLLFSSLTYFLLTGLISLGIWQEERLLYRREQEDGCYGPGAYLLSKVMCDLLPLRVFPALLYTSIMYAMAGLQAKLTNILIFMGVLVLYNVACSTLFMCVGIACQRTSVALLLGALVSLFCMLLSGYAANKASMPSWATWTLEFSVMHAAWESLMINEFTGLLFEITGATPDSQLLVTGELILGKFGLSTDPDIYKAHHHNSQLMYVNTGVLVGLIVLGHLMSYSLLKYPGLFKRGGNS